MQSCLLLRERFSLTKKKLSQNVSLKPIFLRNLFLPPINFVYSDRGPAIVSDEIMVEDVVEGKISK